MVKFLINYNTSIVFIVSVKQQLFKTVLHIMKYPVHVIFLPKVTENQNQFINMIWILSCRNYAKIK